MAKYGEVLKNLRKVRESRFLNQAELAEKSGVGRTTIARAESGNNVVSYPNIKKLAAALGVEPAELVGESDRLAVVA